MKYSDVIGHARQIAVLRRAVASGRLHHAYLLVGPEGVGKPLVALALGGAIGFVALATKTELSLPVIAGVFVVELFSDVIQVGYFKATGKRVFLMAPIHHHFEKMGWPESRIVVRFWIVTMLLCLVGFMVTTKIAPPEAPAASASSRPPAS